MLFEVLLENIVVLSMVYFVFSLALLNEIVLFKFVNQAPSSHF